MVVVDAGCGGGGWRRGALGGAGARVLGARTAGARGAGARALLVVVGVGLAFVASLPPAAFCAFK